MKTLLTSLISIVAVASPSLSWAARAEMDRPDVWHHHGWGWGYMTFGPLMMVLFFGAMVVVVMLSARWLRGSADTGTRGPGVGSNRPLDILKERYARGEIDEKEFEERKRILAD